MNKKILAIAAATLVFGLASCGGSDTPAPGSSKNDTPTSSQKESAPASEAHQHTFAETWEKNENYHWHKATCEHEDQTSGKAGHKYGDPTVIKAATCDEVGSQKKSCTVCGFEKEEEVPATGHVYDEGVAAGEGVKKYTCKGCGTYNYTYEFTAKKPDKGSKTSFTIDMPKYCNVNVGIIAAITSSDHTNRYFYCDPDIESTDNVESNPENKGKYRYTMGIDERDLGNDNELTYGDNGLTTGEYKTIMLAHNADVAKGLREFSFTASDVLGYRLSIKGIVVEVNQEYAEPEGFTATFDADAHAKVLVYPCQDYTLTPVAATSAIARDSQTRFPLNDGEGQVNFKIVVDEGYEIDTVTATKGSYKNIKLVEGYEAENIWRVTKINMDTTITIKTKLEGAEEVGYKVTFVHDDKVQVKVFPKQTIDGDDGVITDEALARGSKTGIPARDGQDQINFVLIVKSGYVVNAENIVVTPNEEGNKPWNALKQNPESDGRMDSFRVTKVSGDIVITITAVAA